MDRALHLGHRRGRGKAGEVEAPRSVMEVRVQTSLQRLIEHHLVGSIGQSLNSVMGSSDPEQWGSTASHLTPEPVVRKRQQPLQVFHDEFGMF